MRIFYSVLIFIASFLMIKYREKLQTVSGPITFAEKYLGTGGTFTLYALVGSFGVILSIVILFNAHSTILEKVTRLFFG